MNESIDISRGPSDEGSTTRPAGEKLCDTPVDVTGEASREALASQAVNALASHSSDVQPGSGGSGAPTTSEGPLELSTDEIEIVRATTRIQIEPWRLAEDADAHRQVRCVRDECSACRLISALYTTQRSVVSAANTIARRNERIDGAIFDAFKLELASGAAVERKKIEWGTAKGSESYQLVRKLFPTMLSSIAATLTKQIDQKWLKERWEILAKNERSAARYSTSNMPIPMPQQAVRLRWVEGVYFELECSFTARPGAKDKEYKIPLRARDDHQLHALKSITSCDWKIGQLQIQRDRRGKWHLRVSYKRRVARVKGHKVAAVNRGITCILAAVTEDGEELIYDGHDIEAYLAQMHNRRKAIQNTYRVSGRKGRGRARALAPIKHLQGKADRWRKTRIQTIAREVANWLQKRGITIVKLDDLEGIRDGAVELLDGGKPVWDRIQSWPYFEMGSRLTACLQEYGIAVEKVRTEFISRNCPQCDHLHEIRKTGRKFKCVNCGYYKHIDVIAGMNLMHRPPKATVGAKKPRKRR